jgi:hypothetical protein
LSGTRWDRHPEVYSLFKNSFDNKWRKITVLTHYCCLRTKNLHYFSRKTAIFCRKWAKIGIITLTPGVNLWNKVLARIWSQNFQLHKTTFLKPQAETN